MLEARTAVLEWSIQHGAGEHTGVEWADPLVTPTGEPFRITRSPSGPQFRHLSISEDLPTPLVQAAADAQASGYPTALEGLTLLFAPAQWLTSTLSLCWTPFSATPGLLSSLVEAYGIDAELHDRDPAALKKLLVYLPRWFERRGQIEPAINLLRAALDADVPVRIHPSSEVAFTCQSTAWWAERAPHSTLTVRDRVVQSEAPGDDLGLGWMPTDRFPHELLRLLPTWASPRLALETR